MRPQSLRPQGSRHHGLRHQLPSAQGLGPQGLMPQSLRHQAMAQVFGIIRFPIVANIRTIGFAIIQILATIGFAISRRGWPYMKNVVESNIHACPTNSKTNSTDFLLLEIQWYKFQVINYYWKSNNTKQLSQWPDASILRSQAPRP